LPLVGGRCIVSALDAAWVAANLAEAETSPVSHDDLSLLSLHLVPTVMERGMVLFREGEHPGGVWILQSGAIELICGSGASRAVVRMLGPGEAVGDIQILRGVRSSFKARAVELSECLFLDRHEFLALLMTSPTIARRWASKLALQVSRNHDRIVALLTSALRTRIARFLVQESVDGVFRHSQGTIASMLGVHRSSVNEIVGEFERLGLVEVTYRCIRIVDERGLEKWSETTVSA
jgi:CRP-like cAMP-binding protein